MSDPKFCKDCKHFEMAYDECKESFSWRIVRFFLCEPIQTPNFSDSTCLRKKMATVEYDLVSGKKTEYACLALCARERTPDGDCGVEGKYFEPKETK